MIDNSAPDITGIHHVSVTVRDLETSAAWYQRVFRTDRVPMTFPHYEREDSGYGVLLVDQRSGLVIGLHTNVGNDGREFDEARTGLDHVGFNVASRAQLEAWAVRLGELGVKHSGIRSSDQPFPFATLVFRDPDNIQLELFTVG
jgi:glyoxylase I family protein